MNLGIILWVIVALAIAWAFWFFVYLKIIRNEESELNAKKDDWLNSLGNSYESLIR